MWPCQVVTCVPTSVLPKRCRQVGQETDTIIGDNGEADDDVIDEMGERGHILWIRGLSRLQHQVGQHTAQYKRGRVSARASNWSTLFECGVFVSVFCIIGKWNIGLGGVPSGQRNSYKCREMPSCYAGSVPKSSSGPPRGASWVTLTTEGAQARNWRYNQ